MMTNVAATADCHLNTPPAANALKVVIVNGNPEMLELLDTMLAAGHYDVVFVESSEHAYSQIKRVQPNQTRGIPVLTYTTEYEGRETEEELLERSETELFSAKAAVWMN